MTNNRLSVPDSEERPIEQKIKRVSRRLRRPVQNWETGLATLIYCRTTERAPKNRMDHQAFIGHNN
jgi:hypothetical protein